MMLLLAWEVSLRRALGWIGLLTGPPCFYLCVLRRSKELRVVIKKITMVHCTTQKYPKRD